MLTITPEWKVAFPGACAGILVIRGADNPASHAALAQRKAELEVQLRAEYQDRPLNNETLEIYTKHYKRFKKTHHVKLQLKSIVQKGKSIPDVQALVQAMFMAEMKSFILTAGHDTDLTRGTIHLDSSQGDEIYQNLRGDQVTCKAGDMLMSDSQAVICSIIYGQDQRTRITKHTRRVLYVMYVPPGIEAGIVENHILDIERNVVRVFPHSKAGERQVILADSPAAITF